VGNDWRQFMAILAGMESEEGFEIMDTLKAFAMGQASRNNRARVFDWNKAAQIIKECQCKTASAGLSGDWEWTGGEIFTNGKPNLEDYTYLASTWAMPEIEIDGKVFPCWVYEDQSDWNSHTKWPESALKILEA